MIILSWNVNGLRQLHKSHHFMDAFRHNPDIVCIQETKSPQDKIPLEIKKLTGYHSYFADVDKDDFAETALFTRQQPCAIRSGFGSVPDKEGRVLAADYGSFLLLNMYFPLGIEPAGTLAQKLEFFDRFLAYLSSLNNNGKKIVVCGDFSVAHKDLDTFSERKKASRQIGITPEEREKMDALVNLGFTDAFRMYDSSQGRYSWWPNGFAHKDRSRGWRLDYFFVNEAMKPFVKDSGIIDGIEGSDHCPVFLELKI